MEFYITGDTHGKWDRLLFLKEQEKYSAAVIVLGDFGANFVHDRMENSRKDTLNSFHNYIYALRGNHDDRPEDLEDVKEIYDDNVNGYVYCQERRWPNIRYLKDGGEYTINSYKILCIGGAYSVDKEFRLMLGYAYNPRELLTKDEMNNIYRNIKGKSYDFVFTHTCPYSWQPTDLFLKGLDQSKVDKSMEEWLEEVKDNVEYKVWLFGHFHNDRIIRPHVELMYHNVQTLDEIYDRWKKPESDPVMYAREIDPKYYAKDNMWSEQIQTL